MNPSSDLVNRLWRLCALLRKDGVTYLQYVTELTYLLFLKMASEQKDESRIPEQYRWTALRDASETEVLSRYRRVRMKGRRAAGADSHARTSPTATTTSTSSGCERKRTKRMG